MNTSDKNPRPEEDEGNWTLQEIAWLVVIPAVGLLALAISFFVAGRHFP